MRGGGEERGGATSWLHGERLLYWEQIDRVTYNAIGSWYRFRSDQGWSIRVSIYRSGLRSLAQLVAAHIKRSPAREVPARFYLDAI